MAQAGIRRTFTPLERAEVWRRWKGGRSVSDIVRALDREPGTVHSFLSATGGIAQPARRRSKKWPTHSWGKAPSPSARASDGTSGESVDSNGRIRIRAELSPLPP